jgi:hypothetical protein
MPRTCLFCGSPAGSQEHLLPGWAGRTLVDEGPTPHRRVRIREGEPVAGQEWRQDPFSLTAGVVCQDCNNGWMSRLETDVQDILSGMLAGRGRVLHRAGQRRLATWAFKTALVGQAQREADRVVPAAVCRAFLGAGRPPDDHRIWILGYSGDQLHGFFDSFGADADPSAKDPSRGERDVYGVTFGFGPAVFQVLGSPVIDVVATRPVDGGRMRSLWPYEGSFTWAPRRDLTTTGVFDLSGRSFADLRVGLAQAPR